MPVCQAVVAHLLSLHFSLLCGHTHQWKCRYKSGLSHVKKTSSFEWPHASKWSKSLVPNLLPSLFQTPFTMLLFFAIQMSFSHNFFPVNDFEECTETRALQMSAWLSTSLHRPPLFNKAFPLTSAFWDLANDYFIVPHFSWTDFMMYEDGHLPGASALHLGRYFCQQNL